jgi:site-specific DNA-methyltransferase (adenine-specific)
MSFSDQFFCALGIDPSERRQVTTFSERSGIPLERLRYYNDANVIPSGEDLDRIIATSGTSKLMLMLSMGHLSREMLNDIQANATAVAKVIGAPHGPAPALKAPKPPPRVTLETELGRMYQGDCIELMQSLDSDSVDMIFADPPFNLNKLYPSSINDNLKTERYLEWCEIWISECIRLLKHGGALFLWNLPRWNVEIAAFLSGRMSPSVRIVVVPLV